MKSSILVAFLLFLSASAWAGPYDGCSVPPSPSALPPFNRLVMDAVKEMPATMKYDAHDARIDALSTSIRNVDGRIQVSPLDAGNSFCSASTYLVLMKALASAQESGGAQVSSGSIDALLVHPKVQQPDGYGAWGRWNADGPGMAVMVRDLGIGANFTRLDEALPGDFLKVFWNGYIGEDGKHSESGHSVVFDSFRECSNGPNVCFWSANSRNDVSAPGDGADRKGGWALKCVVRSKVVRAVLSRITNPNAFNNAAAVLGGSAPDYVNQRLNEIGSTSLMSPEEMYALIRTSGNP